MSAAHYRERISKACQPCRRRKVKCDGAQPCPPCKRHNTQCTYRALYRGEPKPEQTEELAPQLRSESLDLPGSITSDLETPLVDDTHINRSVSATHAASSSCVLQHYYGGSSSFAFLQKIHHALHPDACPRGNQSEVDEGGSGLDTFGLRSLFFNMSQSEKAPQPLDHHLLRPYLPLDLAEIFLAGYLCTLHYLHPFQPPEYLKELLVRFYNSAGSELLDVGDSILIVTILALGATVTDHLSWATILMKTVKTASEPLAEVVNMRAVQALVFGQPNTAYLEIGLAARKAFAAGLHRDLPHQPQDGVIILQERRVTIWCLYFYESAICFDLGRPSSMTLTDISVPYPSGRPLIPGLIQFTTIVSTGGRQMYSYGRIPVKEMWKIAQKVSQETEQLVSTFRETNGLEIANPVVEKGCTVDQIFLTTLHYQLLILTFRPFLTIHLSYIRHQRRPTKQHDSKLTENDWLSIACRRGVNASLSLISFLSKVFETNPIMKGLRLFSFYIESACFLLIYNVLREPSSMSLCVQGINDGLKCLDSLIKDPNIAKGQFAIRKMLDAIEWKYNPNMDRNDNPTNSYTSGYVNSLDNSRSSLVTSEDLVNGDRFPATRLPQSQDTSPLATSTSSTAVTPFNTDLLPNQDRFMGTPDNLGSYLGNMDWAFDMFATEFGDLVENGGFEYL